MAHGVCDREEACEGQAGRDQTRPEPGPAEAAVGRHSPTSSAPPPAPPAPRPPPGRPSRRPQRGPHSCLHVAARNSTVSLTESSDPTGAILRTTPAAWTALVRAVKENRVHG
ncbi:DUF397 domain-containing protein [Streptomyces sp. NPDC047515]|uniref:DUF397 domain-containing protein n=1 Tax=Streptomyces sp. NPDC047515 TaxID=3155380 RepID=UPI0033E113C7